jgi:Domain of unknown function (DUF4178)
MSEISCPACGAPVDVEDRFSESISCPFCGTESYIGDSTKALSSDSSSGEGDHATLANVYSRFEVGQNGHIRWNNDLHEFIIIGRVQYEYEGGFWSEWYIDINGSVYWLQEDEGVYILYIEVPIEKPEVVMEIFNFYNDENRDLRVGSVLNPLINKMEVWNLMECGEATLVASEGDLPFNPNVNKKIFYMDGVGNGVVYSLEIESNGKEGTFFKGWPLEYESIRTENEPEPKKTTGSL